MQKLRLARIQTLELPEELIGRIQKLPFEELRLLFDQRHAHNTARFESAKTSEALFQSVLPKENLLIIHTKKLAWNPKNEVLNIGTISDVWANLTINSFGCISFCLTLEISLDHPFSEARGDVFEEIICPLLQHSALISDYETEILDYLKTKTGMALLRDCIPEASDHLIFSTEFLSDQAIHRIMGRYHSNEEINRRLKERHDADTLIFPGWGRSLILGKNKDIWPAAASTALVCQQGWKLLYRFQNIGLTLQKNLCDKILKTYGAKFENLFHIRDLFSHHKVWFADWNNGLPPKFRDISDCFESAWKLKEKEALVENTLFTTAESFQSYQNKFQSQVLIWITFIQILTISSVWADYLSSNSDNRHFVGAMSNGVASETINIFTLLLMPVSFCATLFLVFYTLKRMK